MKNRILAIILILIICFSMIPLQTFATTNTTLTANEITWKKLSYNGNIYKLQHYYPVYNNTEYPHFFLVEQNGISIIWFNDNTVFAGNDYRAIVSGEVLYMRVSTKSYEDIVDFLYYDNYDRSTLKMGSYTATTYYCRGTGEPTAYAGKYYTEYTAYSYYCSTKFDNLSCFQGTSKSASEAHYAEWYYSRYGMWPQLAAQDFSDIEYMKGNYYAIFKQATIIEDPENPDFLGYVETCDDVLIPSKGMITQDGKALGSVYVVISSSNTEGNLINRKVSAGIGDYIIGSIGSIGIWLNSDVRRNNYDLIHYIFHNPKENLNRYYFKTKQDACKFVLYGTAGAKYIYKEEGKTDYGYGYNDCEYSNYSIIGSGVKEVPIEQYPLGRQEIILMEHGKKGEGRKFVHIELNYYSRVTMIDPYYNLIINNNLTNPIYSVYTQGTGEVKPMELSNYKPDATMNVPSSQTFQLYYEGLENTENTWDVFYSTYDLFIVKQGQIIDGDEYKPIVEVWVDENGNQMTLNNASGQGFTTDSTKPKEDPDGDGKYIDEDGNEYDKNNATNKTEEWQNTITEHLSAIGQLNKLFEDFTEFMNVAKDDVKEISNLLNAWMQSMPSIFRILIMMSLIALLFGRIAKRK